MRKGMVRRSHDHFMSNFIRYFKDTMWIPGLQLSKPIRVKSHFSVNLKMEMGCLILKYIVWHLGNDLAEPYNLPGSLGGQISF